MSSARPKFDRSRRDFVRLTAAAVTPALLAGCTSSKPARVQAASPALAQATPWSGPIRIGLIGCGGRGTGAAVQALRADPQARLVAMGDVFPDRISSSLKGISEEMAQDGPAALEQVQVPPERQFIGFDSHERVLASGIDLVILTSYPHFRPEHLRVAVAAGKHVFAEKPLAVDGPGVRSVIESAAKARAQNTALLVGFCWRYNEGMQAAFDQINHGAVGDVLSVHTTYHSDTLSRRPRQTGWSDMEFQLRNWWHFTWISGDHIVEQAVHSVDRLAWAMKDEMPVRVTCLGGRAARSGPEHGNVFDHFAAIYEYADGRRGFHTCRQIDRCPSDNTDYVYGTRGVATINGWVPTYLIRSRAGQEIWKHPGSPAATMYQREHDALFASIRAGRPINDGERGAHSTLMAIMARMAAYTGQVITWEQALNSTERLGPDSYSLGTIETPSVAVPGKTRFV